MTEYKIFGEGKGTKVIYETLDAAKEAIVKNKILPNYGMKEVIIEETIKNEYKVSVKIPTLSDVNRKFLVDYVVKNLTADNINGHDVKNPIWMLYHEKSEHPEFFKLMREWLEDTYKITQEEIDDAVDKSKYRFCCDSPLDKKLDDRVAYRKAYVDCIKKTFEMADVKENAKPKIKCPVCNSENIADASIYKDNGIYGPGWSQRKVKDMRSCADCGILFIPTPNNNDWDD